MTPADHLAQLARQAGYIAYAWPAWHASMTVELPDGFAAKTPGSGLPGGGTGISDPTLSAVERRHDLTVTEGVDRVRQVHTEINHVVELAATIATVAFKRPKFPDAGTSDGRRLAWTREALDSAAKEARHLESVTILDLGEPLVIASWEAISALYSHVGRLNKLIPAARTEQKFEKAELCHGGVSRGHLEPWGRACSTPAVTMDGLCDTCRKRRDRHEAIAAA